MNNTKIHANNETTGKTMARFLNDTLKEIMSMLNVESGSIFLFDPDRKELILDSFYNSTSPHLKGIRQRIGEGISGKVADIRTPILVKNISKDSRFKCNGFNHYRTNSFISIPLLTSKGLVGLINLADKSSGESFSEKDLEFVVIICRYACLTIESFINSSGLREETEDLNKQKLLLEKYASVGKLAAGVVHEINNPLDGVIRYVNILLEQLAENSVAREYLLEAKKGLVKIANITKSLLEFSHQVNSNSTKVKKYVDVHKLIEESLDILMQKLNGNVIVHKEYKAGLPRILDFGLSHVFINILENALDAMSNGGGLGISTDIKGSMVTISFKDTGVGMAPEVKDHIFEPFFTTKSMDKGTGLGLAISKEIISKYAQATIAVESCFEKGSTFTVLIPKGYLENA